MSLRQSSRLVELQKQGQIICNVKNQRYKNRAFKLQEYLLIEQIPAIYQIILNAIQQIGGGSLNQHQPQPFKNYNFFQIVLDLFLELPHINHKGYLLQKVMIFLIRNCFKLHNLKKLKETQKINNQKNIYLSQRNKKILRDLKLVCQQIVGQSTAIRKKLVPLKILPWVVVVSLFHLQNLKIAEKTDSCAIKHLIQKINDFFSSEFSLPFYSIIIHQLILIQSYQNFNQQSMESTKQPEKIEMISNEDIKASNHKILEQLEKRYAQKQQQYVKQVKGLQSHLTTLEANEETTEEAKKQTKDKIKLNITNLMKIERKIEVVEQLREEQQLDSKTDNQFEQCVQKSVEEYEPTQEEIETRRQQLMMDLNESNWTDATESDAGDEIWVVDDNIIEAMQHESSEDSESSNSDDQQIKEKQEKKAEINYEELQSQFVVGGQSEHHQLYGQHDKFCVSVNGLAEKNLLLSGGGDDYLFLYNLNKEQNNSAMCLKPYHMVKHTETINKIEVSYSKQYIFTMTDNQILCTEIKTSETKALKSRLKSQKMKKKEQSEQQLPPICSDMACHHLGDVVALFNQFQVELYNIKGLKLYETYYCEKQISMGRFTENGKQICLACQDNRIRLLTPKSHEFSTIAGVQQHKNQISAMATKQNTILTGCIDGYIGISSIKNNTMMTLIGAKETEEVNGSINYLQFAGNYFIAGSAEDSIDWFDLTKAKKIFHSEIEGSSTDIIWQGDQNPHIYDVSTIKGCIYLYDCRNPLKQISKVRAGNTIHKLWAQKHHLGAACEDGKVRYFDTRKLINQ